MTSNAVDIVHVSVERETATMSEIAALLERLDQPARMRVLDWLCSRYDSLAMDY